MALQALAVYEEDIGRILSGMSAGDAALAVEIASLPDGIRGYGPVRATHLARVMARRAALWARASAGRETVRAA